MANKSGIAPSSEVVSDCLKIAFAGGITMLDTAALYGNSETLLGQFALADQHIITKCPSVESGDELRAIFESSLSRLQRNHIYAVMLHRPDDLFSEQGASIAKEMVAMRNEGLVQKIGVSVYEPADISRYQSEMLIDIVQVPFNCFDQRLIQDGTLTKLESENIEVHIRSIFLQGLLVMPAEKRPAWCKGHEASFAKLALYARELKISQLELCWRFAFSFPEIARVVFGVQSPDELTHLLGLSRQPLEISMADLAQSDQNLIDPSEWSA